MDISSAGHFSGVGNCCQLGLGTAAGNGTFTLSQITVDRKKGNIFSRGNKESMRVKLKHFLSERNDYSIFIKRYPPHPAFATFSKEKSCSVERRGANFQHR